MRDGRRERLALFAELEQRHGEKLSTQFGIRSEQVRMQAADVQGYFSQGDSDMMGMPLPAGTIYQHDADLFNARAHARKDWNWDLTAAMRYTDSAQASYELGFSRKTRSPNLHERYTWSNEAMMAGLMNNWFGDLNSYVGNLDLKPERAYSLQAAADWHDAQGQDWQIRLAPFYTLVQDYIDVTPNTDANPYNMSMLGGRQSLRFVNRNARLYGLDLSGWKALERAGGDWLGRASISYLRATSSNGDNLYNIMPLQARLVLEHQDAAWRNTLEGQFVAAKNRVSAVRAEVATPGYALFNYRSSYQISKAVRLDAGIENLLNRQYALPLGGLEFASANMMAGTPAKPLRGPGRSLNASLRVSF